MAKKTPENYGTLEYLQELDDILHELDGVRHYLGKLERKERYTISRAMESLKYLRGKAKKHGLRVGLIEEDDQ
jgi:hypothetical protein